MDVMYKNKVYVWPLSKNDLNFFYCDEKLSLNKIGSLFGVDAGTVSYWCKKHEIKKIECWQRHDLPAKLSDQEIEVILGYVLGDGYISKNCKYAHLRVSQSKNQIAFVNQIYEYLKIWVSYPPVEDTRYDLRFNKKYSNCRFDTVSHPAFDYVYDICYKNGVKTVNEIWLEKIGPLGLALWYQGDGGLNGRVLPYFSTCSFTKNEHELLIEWFYKKWNIKTYSKMQGSYFKLFVKDSNKFRDIIFDLIIPYFRYKLPNIRQSRSRISQENYKEIFNLKENNVDIEEIALKFNISKTYVRDILNKKRLVSWHKDL